jgi:hypothetical protein
MIRITVSQERAKRARVVAGAGASVKQVAPGWLMQVHRDAPGLMRKNNPLAWSMRMPEGQWTRACPAAHVGQRVLEIASWRHA